MTQSTSHIGEPLETTGAAAEARDEPAQRPAAQLDSIARYVRSDRPAGFLLTLRPHTAAKRSEASGYPARCPLAAGLFWGFAARAPFSGSTVTGQIRD
jgi:hypothetical protein